MTCGVMLPDVSDDASAVLFPFAPKCETTVEVIAPRLAASMAGCDHVRVDVSRWRCEDCGELVDSDGRRCARFVAANGYCYNDPIIRRKPQTTTINFDRPTFAAVGAQFVASGTPGQQPPKGSAWLSVASIVHGGIWMANSSGQQFMTTWDQLSVGGYVYTSDHGATWHACNRTVTKGA
jgi:hypothetical protein